MALTTELPSCGWCTLSNTHLTDNTSSSATFLDGTLRIVGSVEKGHHYLDSLLLRPTIPKDPHLEQSQPPLVRLQTVSRFGTVFFPLPLPRPHEIPHLLSHRSSRYAHINQIHHGEYRVKCESTQTVRGGPWFGWRCHDCQREVAHRGGRIPEHRSSEEPGVSRPGT